MGYSYADLKGDKPWVPPTAEPPQAIVEKVAKEYSKRHPELTKRIQEAAIRIAETKGEVTADDVHAACPIPDGIDRRIMTVAFGDRNIWRKTERRVYSTRKENHGREIPVWKLRERDAA